MSDARDVGHKREQAEEALWEYAKALRRWNEPDDEHTRLTLRKLVETTIAEVLPAAPPSPEQEQQP